MIKVYYASPGNEPVYNTTAKHLCLIDFCWQDFVFVDVARTFLSQHALQQSDDGKKPIRHN